MIFAPPPQPVTAACAIRTGEEVYATVQSGARIVVDARESPTAQSRVLAVADRQGGSVAAGACARSTARLKSDNIMTPPLAAHSGFALACFGASGKLVVRLQRTRDGTTRMIVGMHGSAAIVATVHNARTTVSYAGAACFRWHQ